MIDYTVPMSDFQPVVFVNGLADGTISVFDRGFAYGDGLFETLALEQSQIKLLVKHRQRLLRACKTLHINLDPFRFDGAIEQALNEATRRNINEAVIKVMVSRGAGGRGYAADPTLEPTVVVTINPPANHPKSKAENGVAMRLCQHRLPNNAPLAGLKHLNRLDNVIARREWQDPEISEGLMLDCSGNVIEGTFSNIFIIKDNRLLTPKLGRAGVAGVMRQVIIEDLSESLGGTQECDLSLDNLYRADEVFICNSLIGIWPVKKFEQQSWRIGEGTRLLQEKLRHFLAGLS